MTTIVCFFESQVIELDANLKIKPIFDQFQLSILPNLSLHNLVVLLINLCDRIFYNLMVLQYILRFFLVLLSIKLRILSWND